MMPPDVRAANSSSFGKSFNEFIPKSFSIKSKIKQEARITDKKKLETIIKKVLDKNKQAAKDYKTGKKESFNFLMGEIMKTSDRKADFQVARQVLEKMLK